MAKYLDAFTYWFSEEFLVPRMITRLTGDDGCLEALQGLLEDLVLQEPSLRSTEEGEDDVRFWLWDMSGLPARLRMDRAARLLRHAEVSQLGPAILSYCFSWEGPPSKSAWRPPRLIE